VIAGYEQGLTIASAARRADKMNDPAEAQAVLERATRTLIHRVAKGSPRSRRADGSPMPAAA
jgi:hypothetical protein